VTLLRWWAVTGPSIEVGRGLCGSKHSSGGYPCRLGNGFARNFKIPLNQYQAIKLLLSPQIVSVDSGKINDHHFFNVAGFGLDANICQHFEEFGIRGPIPISWSVPGPSCLFTLIRCRSSWMIKNWSFLLCWSALPMPGIWEWCRYCSFCPSR